MEIALHLSVRMGRLDNIKYLVSMGGDIHSDDNLALKNATKFEKSEVVQYLKGLIYKNL